MKITSVNYQNNINPLPWVNEARIYAESVMQPDWNRNDPIDIGNFYVHMLRYIDMHFELIKKNAPNEDNAD